MQPRAQWNRAASLAVLAAVACISTGSPAQENQPESAEMAIRRQAEAYVKAYNAHDAVDVAACWAEDAVYIHPASGERVTGRSAIQKMFEESFAAQPNLRMEVLIDAIRLVGADAAVEDGRAKILAEGATPEETTYTAVHVKKGDQWLIDSVRETVVPEGPGESIAESFENLKDLDWLVGEWIDESEESTVEANCQWAKNKSFLTRSFRLSAPGADDLEGTQVIGWDPVARVIRVWVFDSDGGFAEGVCRRKEGGAIVEMRGVNPEGQAVSATQILRRIDDDTFTFRSVNRSVGDERLPDLDEFRVVRKQ